MRTSNPAFNQPAFAPPDWRGIAADQSAAMRGSLGEATRAAGTMSLSGTMAKTSFLLGICSASALGVYVGIERGILQGPAVIGVMAGGAILGLILGLFIGFKPTTAPWLAWLYALAEGCFLGGLSYLVADRLGEKADGLIFQAVSLTMGIAAAAVALSWTGLLRLSGTAMKVIMVATLGVGLLYLANILLRLFGVGEIGFIHGSGPIGIGFSLFVVGLASFNLVMDLQMVKDAAESGAPKHYEWYSGFALLVTLVWLYIEVLRLLAKLRRE